MGKERILHALNRTAQARIIVFGDYALDKYFYMDPENDEPSAETGLSAYQINRKHLSAGVGGTITQNLRALGANVICIGITGNDGEGYELTKILDNIGADTRYMIRTDKMSTCAYYKPMRKQPDGEYTEMNRLDIRNLFEPPKEIQEELLKNLETAIPEADAVLVTDQFYQRNMGAITDCIRDELGRLAQKYPEKLFYADSRSFINEYKNMILKCNNFELFSKFAGGKGNPESLDEIRNEGTKICEKTGHVFFVTRGSEGIAAFDGDECKIIPAFKVTGKIDIVGAGDATNASLVLGLVLGLTPEESATLACAVSSITIRQIGTTGTASPDEIRRVLEVSDR